MLTRREEQILEQLSEGKLNKEIADNLQISTDTVKKHLKNIYKKLNVRNRCEAIIQTQKINSLRNSI